MLWILLLGYCLSSATCSGLLSRPRRSWIIDSFTVEEGHPGPFPYVLGKINIVREYRIYFDLYGQGVDEEPKGVLSIHKESGYVSVHKAVDYELWKTLTLKLEARRIDLSIDTKLGVEITILDINDNPPRFQQDLYEINVAEEAAQGSHLMTVVAVDRDKQGTLNSTFHYEIKSVSPDTPDTKFSVDEFGVISFNGCLDHEEAEIYTVEVEAKDHGEVVSLSSSTTIVINIQDGNNHLPTISGQTGSGKVKEDESGVSPLRLHVTDKDSRNSPAWRAKYSIQGDDGKHFKIETDPDTNDGILTVVKPLDYEAGAQRQLSISVENEAAYFFCKVKKKTSTGLWDVDTSTDDPGGGQPHSVNVLIEVEDVNDPPVFTVSVKETQLEENAPIGTWVETVTAVDPDSHHARDFVYKVGSDPAGWVTVDPETGNITTIKYPDRESPHVVNGIYTILLYAVDMGEPPMTGTATLNIHVTDQNDNVPQPTENYVDVCLSDGTTNFTAFDPDGDPFGGPFSFELLGDAKGKWKLSPSHGYTAGLVREPSVYAGPHTIDVKISDMQGQFGVYNVSVTVCDCSVTPNCRSRRETATQPTAGAIIIVLASLLLILLLLLLAIKITSKKEFTSLQSGESSGETLLVSNIETPGTDCRLSNSVMALSPDTKHNDQFDGQIVHDGMQQGQAPTKVMVQSFYKNFEDYRRENFAYLFKSHMDWNSTMANGYHENYQTGDISTMTSLYRGNMTVASDAALLALLHRRLSALQEPEDDLLDYKPHIYSDEGDFDTISELESIDTLYSSTSDSLQEALNNLGPKFKQLAAICKPPDVQN